MALPLPPGLTPAETAFLCEMELVTVLPRQRLESLELLGGPTPALAPPHRADIPLWLALLLKRQKRANIVPPPWLHPDSLNTILEIETEHESAFAPAPPLPSSNNNNSNTASTSTTTYAGLDATTSSPPFVLTSTASAPPTALPYHWLELGEMLLSAAPDDFADPDLVRRLMRDLREVRMAKLRAGVDALDAGAGVRMNGVGGMEVAEGRSFIAGVVDGLRRVGASREQARREREAEDFDAAGAGAREGAYSDDEMEL
ncbi:uncharacterized protein K452DRAFT_350902 [Aplosporella prunicola CBS 121167]|uniref:DNA replication complex GINS protein PSF2 n=1 Tax=Aplosporella prunicola CBS 121167 TaxID=1176127 RepID=A0A6A6BEL1_9PEZI|nr:uncharacterized protein K452DRAFT_350902 [Aplosporella prunicola CBS 121167]KAF2142590.1 hypothetical protein K452DRAFT_350902 [Aplosporella prunicola CBS 121167]